MTSWRPRGSAPTALFFSPRGYARPISPAFQPPAATVARSSRVFDPAAGTMRIELTLDNKDLTLPAGLTGRVSFSLPPTPGTFLVPTNTLVVRNGQSTLATVRDGKIAAIGSDPVRHVRQWLDPLLAGDDPRRRAAEPHSHDAHERNRESRKDRASPGPPREPSNHSQYGDRRAEAQLLHEDEPRGGEGADRDAEEQRRRGHDPPGALQPLRDGIHACSWSSVPSQVGQW